MAVSLAVLVIFHLVWGGINLYFWAVNGLQAVLDGLNLVERVYYSTYLRWMIIADLTWIFFAVFFLFSRKHYKTNPALHYLSKKQIINPQICIIIPTFNEEIVVEEVIKGYQLQQNVKNIIVVDNNSSDNTVKIAKECGVKVITKDVNRGYADSCIIGLKESLKTDANIMVLTESDGTFEPSDISKMIPYLDNCEMVIGTRQIQVLSEKGNQNSMFYVWGNLFLAKLIQIKFFSLLHMGVVNLSDVGCSYRCIRRDALEKIIDDIVTPDKRILKTANGWLFSIFFTMLAIKNDLKLVEIPISFKKRTGESKSQANVKTKGIIYGLHFLWYIISS